MLHPLDASFLPSMKKERQVKDESAFLFGSHQGCQRKTLLLYS